MKIIYKQGDIVRNENNQMNGIVVDSYDDYVKILELDSTGVFINNVPTGALTYLGKCNLKEKINEIIGNIHEEKKELKVMENKPLIFVVGGEIEDEKKKAIEDIKKENPDMNFLEIINEEANCHPKKQSLSAENFARHIAVKGQNAIMTTNSFHFLEAFLFYLQKYEAYGNVRFYLVADGNVKKSDNSHDVMKNLSQPAFDLADEKLAYEMEGCDDDEDEEYDE